MLTLRLIFNFLWDMLPYMAISLPIFALVRWLMLRQNKRSANLYHELGMLLFVALQAGLASQAVLPKLALDAGGLHVVETYRVSGINLIPGIVFVDSYQQAMRHHNLIYFFINIIGNMAVFMPLGFFLPLLWRKSRKTVLITAFLCSLAIELCQLPQARGTDIDDIWLNTLGAFIGYTVWRLLDKKLPT